MGILDDAIRQHLELKRRQGAEENELQRLEDEAFGPPSRPGEPEFGEQESQGEAPAVAATADEAPSVAPSEGETGESSFFDASVDESLPVPDEQMALDSTEAPTSDPEEASISSLETVEHPFEEAVDEGGEEPMPPADEQGALEEEVLEGELAGEEGDEADEEGDETGEAGGEEDEDVLEETPEFLRDAPEDDELWFEQGEPKDFDF
jgi:hypothetical protein